MAGSTQMTIVSLWMSMPQQRRYASFIFSVSYREKKNAEKVNRSFLNGLPPLRCEPHSFVPTPSGPHSRTASQCQTIIGLYRLRSFEYRSCAPVFITVCGQTKRATCFIRGVDSR